jgi:hypothetical protein
METLGYLDKRLRLLTSSYMGLKAMLERIVRAAWQTSRSRRCCVRFWLTKGTGSVRHIAATATSSVMNDNDRSQCLIDDPFNSWTSPLSEPERTS